MFLHRITRVLGRPLLSAAALTLILALSLTAGPPPTPVSIVTDTVHGVVIEDPYRWLENGDSGAIARWTEAQWSYLRDYIDSYPDKERLHNRINELMSIGSISTPEVRDSLYFFKQRDSTQNHAVLYIQKGLDGIPTVLLDPNTFSEDGTVALDWSYLSDDGSLIAYGTSAGGSEQSTLYVMCTADRTMLPDTIPYTASTSLAWLPDNSGFFYTRFPVPGTVPSGDERYHRWVYLHKLGDDWMNDSLIFGQELDKTAWTAVSLSPDGRRLIVSAFRGWSNVDTYYDDRADTAGFVRLHEETDAMITITPLDDRFIVLTDLDAPHKRVLVGGYLDSTTGNWMELIPERDAILQSVIPIGGRLVTRSLKNAYSVVEMFTMEGEPIRTLPTPTLGTVYSVKGELDGDELFYYYTSFNMPSTIFRYDYAADTVIQWAQLDPGADVSDIVVKQIWYNSKDGTPVSMFLVHQEDIALDGSNPTYLYGYGGFTVSMTPYFSRLLTLWYDQGGVYALPNLRGGGEYGEAWHKAGMLANKQNTFDDFIAAAEHLIEQGYTSPEKLCISGGSNGGLLTGAVLVQRPELFGAAIVAVPLLDMIRYQQFQVARIWIPEYGSSEDPEQFEYLLTYSPYHNIKDSTDYPPVLLTAGLSDSRVDPMHARKMTARLQAADTTTDSRVLLRIEPKAGHGQGKPVSKQIEAETDEWVFVFKALGLRMK